MSPSPLSIEATIRGDDPIYPYALTTVRGQHAIAVSRGEVLDVRLDPPEPVACTEAIEAVSSADWLVFGPGSWFTSVIPHLLVPDLAAAITSSRGASGGYPQPRSRAGDGRAFTAGSSPGTRPLPARPASRCSSSRWESSWRPHGIATCGRIAGCAGGAGSGRRRRRLAKARSGRASGRAVRGVRRSDPPSSEHRSERPSEERNGGGEGLTDPPLADRITTPTDAAVAPHHGPPGPDSNAR